MQQHLHSFLPAQSSATSLGQENVSHFHVSLTFPALILIQVIPDRYVLGGQWGLLDARVELIHEPAEFLVYLWVFTLYVVSV